MRTETVLKLGQLAGALLMSAGVASCIMSNPNTTFAACMFGGMVLYAICRLADWFRRP